MPLVFISLNVHNRSYYIILYPNNISLHCSITIIYLSRIVLHCSITELRTQNLEYLFAVLIHQSILQRTTDTTCGPQAICDNH